MLVDPEVGIPRRDGGREAMRACVCVCVCVCVCACVYRDYYWPLLLYLFAVRNLALFCRLTQPAHQFQSTKSINANKMREMRSKSVLSVKALSGLLVYSGLILFELLPQPRYVSHNGVRALPPSICWHVHHSPMLRLYN